MDRNSLSWLVGDDAPLRLADDARVARRVAATSRRLDVLIALLSTILLFMAAAATIVRVVPGAGH